MNRRKRETGMMVLWAAGLLAAAGVAGGCRGDRFEKPPREFLPDMDHQPKWLPQSGSEFFEDGNTARVPDRNTVAFGRASFDPAKYGQESWASSFMQERAGFIADDDAVYRGRAADDSYIDYIPVPVTLERIERGQERFNIFCATCHGYEGDGQGTAAPYFIAKPVNLHLDLYTDPAQRTALDGYMFEVIRNGVRNMPGYAYSINVEDTWNIVMYVRALQEARKASIDSLPAAERDALLRERPPAPPAGDAGGEVQP